MTITFPQGPTRPDDIAVIIGNADYKKQGKDIPNVKPAYADAASFKKYAMTTLGIREGNIIDMRDATGAQMNRVFGTQTHHQGQLSDWVRKDTSNIYVYYAGHGAPGGSEGNAYLIPSDADSSRIEINGYPLDTLYDNLARLPAKSVTVVLEACFSGSSPAGAVISNASPVYLKAKTPDIPKNITVIAAGASDQMASWEDDGSNGLFTKYYLKGMSGEADKKPSGNGDGIVAHEELKAYLHETLSYYARRYYGRDQTAVFVVGGGE
ncbi:MAG: caspase family protein [Rhodospirillales bacterium]|nr:caspase family protein [Rhodospirillales bacterium]